MTPDSPSRQPSEASWPTVEAYLYASKDETCVGRALALHYPATNGDGPPTCAVCYFYAGGGFTDVTAEPWPCPTVRALVPPPTSGPSGGSDRG